MEDEMIKKLLGKTIISKLTKCENEFEVMSTLLANADSQRFVSMYYYSNTFEQVSKECDPEEMENKSRLLREDGNKLYKSKAKDKENCLIASCRLYTDAIYAAPEHSEALALAHANRAVVLLEFGYYQEAYDDCKCAKEIGYPEEKVEKVILRQAKCSWKMGDAESLDLHLKELAKMKLDTNMTHQVKALRAGFIKLSSDEEKKKKVASNESLFQQKTQTIVETSGPRGSYMIATHPIKSGELIFSDCAAVFVPDTETKPKICHQCAKTLFIPFPCYQCNGEVVYCSLNCRNMHEDIHKYECFAYKQQLFTAMNVSTRLSLRLILQELPKVMPLLRDKRNAKKIWEEFTNRNSIIEKEQMGYMRVLHLLTNFDKMPLERILTCALLANLIVFYLKESTTFFKLMEDSKASQSDWKLALGSLLLRHICQINVNITVSLSIGLDTSGKGFSLMSDRLWMSPYHVRRGYLHKFSNCNPVLDAIYPYLSKCNHACERSFERKSCGRLMYAHAVNDMKTGDEIFFSYHPDYRQSTRIERQKKMESFFYFKCECDKCKRSNPDQDLEKFHRYRCNNPKCGTIFVPSLSNLRWWINHTDLICTNCEQIQDITWLRKVSTLIENVEHRHLRMELFNTFDNLNEVLMENSEIKITLAVTLTKKCLAAHNAGLYLTDMEFKRLVPIVEGYVSTAAAMFNTNNDLYIAMTLSIWDLIALGKYKCSQEEMQSRLKAIEVISDEIKKIMLNYYEDYIKSVLI